MSFYHIENYTSPQAPQQGASELFNYKDKVEIKNDYSSLLPYIAIRQQQMQDKNMKFLASLSPESQFSNIRKDLLNKVFFSKENVMNIHQGIKNRVYQESNKQYKLGDQSLEDLYIIMEDTFSKYARHINSPKEVVKAEVGRLNNIVLNRVVPDVLNNVTLQRSYIQYITYDNTPEKRPEFTSTSRKSASVNSYHPAQDFNRV